MHSVSDGQSFTHIIFTRANDKSCPHTTHIQGQVYRDKCSDPQQSQVIKRVLSQQPSQIV